MCTRAAAGRARQSCSPRVHCVGENGRVGRQCGCMSWACVEGRQRLGVKGASPGTGRRARGREGEAGERLGSFRRVAGVRTVAGVGGA